MQDFELGLKASRAFLEGVNWYISKRELMHKGLLVTEFICDSSKFEMPPDKYIKVIWVRDGIIHRTERNGIEYPFFHEDIQTQGPETLQDAREKLAKQFEEFYAEDIKEEKPKKLRSTKLIRNIKDKKKKK